MGKMLKLKHEITNKSDWDSFEVIFPLGFSCFFGFARRRQFRQEGLQFWVVQ